MTRLRETPAQGTLTAEDSGPSPAPSSPCPHLLSSCVGEVTWSLPRPSRSSGSHWPAPLPSAACRGPGSGRESPSGTPGVAGGASRGGRLLKPLPGHRWWRTRTGWCGACSCCWSWGCCGRARVSGAWGPGKRQGAPRGEPGAAAREAAWGGGPADCCPRRAAPACGASRPRGGSGPGRISGPYLQPGLRPWPGSRALAGPGHRPGLRALRPWPQRPLAAPRVSQGRGSTCVQGLLRRPHLPAPRASPGLR